jgi:hypothetical protein
MNEAANEQRRKRSERDHQRYRRKKEQEQLSELQEQACIANIVAFDNYLITMSNNNHNWETELTPEQRFQLQLSRERHEQMLLGKSCKPFVKG